MPIVIGNRCNRAPLTVPGHGRMSIIRVDRPKDRRSGLSVYDIGDPDRRLAPRLLAAGWMCEHNG